MDKMDKLTSQLYIAALFCQPHSTVSIICKGRKQKWALARMISIVNHATQHISFATFVWYITKKSNDLSAVARCVFIVYWRFMQNKNSVNCFATATKLPTGTSPCLKDKQLLHLPDVYLINNKHYHKFDVEEGRYYMSDNTVDRLLQCIFILQAEIEASNNIIQNGGSKNDWVQKFIRSSCVYICTPISIRCPLDQLGICMALWLFLSPLDSILQMLCKLRWAVSKHCLPSWVASCFPNATRAQPTSFKTPASQTNDIIVRCLFSLAIGVNDPVSVADYRSLSTYLASDILKCLYNKHIGKAVKTISLQFDTAFATNVKDFLSKCRITVYRQTMKHQKTKLCAWYHWFKNSVVENNHVSSQHWAWSTIRWLKPCQRLQ